MGKYRVLFLCTGNSCRSQLAEALVNHTRGETWQAFSAGSRPAGYVHPLAFRALAEVGIEHRGESKSMSVFFGQAFDLVITVCDDAAEDCPVWLGKARRRTSRFPTRRRRAEPRKNGWPCSARCGMASARKFCRI